MAAVIGQTVPLDLWQTMAEADEDALRDLIEHAGEARVLMETTEGEAVRFLHALTRQALYEGIPAIRRKRLHRQIGEVIAVMPKAHPDTVAYHFRSAGDARATGWLVKAGWRAYRSFAYETAQSRFAETLTRIGWGGACAHPALAHATAPRQPLALLAAHRLLGELATKAGRYEGGDAHLQASPSSPMLAKPHTSGH